MKMNQFQNDPLKNHRNIQEEHDVILKGRRLLGHHRCETSGKF